MEEVVYYGVFSLIPVITLLVLAAVTRRLLESLIIATLTGFVIIDGIHFFTGWIDGIYASLANEICVWILLTIVLFGIIATLLERSGGALSFGKLGARFAKTQNQSLFATFIAGLLIFVDDFLNALAVGGAMRNLTDKHKIPREALGYVVNTSGSPVCVLVPISTWAIFMIGLIELQGITYNGSATSAYIHSIPYMVYAILALVVAMIFSLGILPKWGAMKEAYQRAESGNVFPDDNTLGEDEGCKIETDNPKVIDFIIPMTFLIAVTLYTGDIILGGGLAILSAALLYIPRKKLSLGQFFDSIIDGVKSMLYVLLVIVFIYVLLEVNAKLGLTEYVIEVVEPYMSATWLPVLSFCVVAVLAFFTASYWEIVAIALPIIAPLALSLGVNPFLTVGAIVSGSLFGCHACFYSDVFVVVSQVAQVRPIDMFRAQIPYVALSGGISLVIFTVLGFII